MAEPMNGDFRKLLDEQKKSNELLSSINTGQQEQGTAKEIVKQALPEIANERQLHKQRMKFEKKEGKTEVDEKVEKQTKTIEKGQKEEKLSSDRVAKFLENSNSKLKELYNLQFAFANGREKMDEATRKFNNAFYGSSRERNVKENKAIKLEEERLQLQRTEIERRGGNAEKDAQYKIDMLALERRKARLERRNRSGAIAATAAAAKNGLRQLKELVLTRQGIYLISDGIKGLVKGLFRGAGRAIGGAATSLFGIAKKFALLAFLPALIAFLNSDLFEDIKVIISENLIPALIKLRDNVFIPLKNFFSDIFLGTFENIKILLFGEGGSFDNPKEGSLGSALKKFKDGDIFGGLKDIVLSLTNFLKNSVNEVFEALKKNILEPVFGIDLGDKTIYGLITGFFQSIFDKVKSLFTSLGQKISYAFSLQNGLLADLWDTAFPLLKGRNPFRRKELELKQDLMNREDVRGLDQTTINTIKQFRDLGIRGNQTTQEKATILSGGIVKDGVVQTPDLILKKSLEKVGIFEGGSFDDSALGKFKEGITFSSIISNIKKQKKENLQNIDKSVGSFYNVAELEKELELAKKELEIRKLYGRGFNPNRTERMFQDENASGGFLGVPMPGLVNIDGKTINNFESVNSVGFKSLTNSNFAQFSQDFN